MPWKPALKFEPARRLKMLQWRRQWDEFGKHPIVRAALESLSPGASFSLACIEVPCHLLQMRRRFWGRVAYALEIWATLALSHGNGASQEVWRILDPPSFLQPRWLQTSVWTGSELITWGGLGTFFYSDGGRYDPQEKSWRLLAAADLAGRWAHHSAWTGSEMLIWGGSNRPEHVGGVLGDGALYSPHSNTWRPMNTVGAPSGRVAGVSVWTGTDWIIWGGKTTSGTLPVTGALFNPQSNTWRPMSAANAPAGRFFATAVWTGSSMIIWGGEGAAGVRNDGAIYHPATDSWTTIATAGAPTPRLVHTAVWSGSEMIIFGGTANLSSPIPGGARYNPSTGTWRNLPGLNAPIARHFHTAVWNGSEMIIWGGGNPFTSSGAIYSPSSDQWRSMPDAPVAGRGAHSALWTGSGMLIFAGWGGQNYKDLLLFQTS